MNADVAVPLIQRASLSEQAYEAIKRMILELRLKPGQIITEAELSELLAISKSPIRSALIHLHRDGLVTITPYKETMVARLDVAQVRQLYEVRSLIEPHVVGILAPLLGEDDLAAIADTLRRAGLALDGQAFPAFFATNTEFHGFFIRRHGNEFFWRTFQAVDYQMQRIRMLSSVITDHPQKQMAEHRRIFEAVCAHDSAASATAMREHILGYFDDLMNEIETGRIPWFTVPQRTGERREG